VHQAGSIYKIFITVCQFLNTMGITLQKNNQKTAYFQTSSFEYY